MRAGSVPWGGLFRPCLSEIAASLYEFLFTPVCCHCSAPIIFGERFLCRPCLNTLNLLDPGDPLLQKACRRLTGDGTFDQLIALYRFEKGSPLQSLLHELKYGGRMGAGLFLGRRLGAVVGERVSTEEFSGCLAVPLHHVRRRERGYNQSVLLCRGLASASGVPACGSLLKRVRATPSQTFLGSEERAANVEEAFALRRGSEGQIGGRSILVVDDVLTTGATMRACAEVLRRAGARRLVACTVAIAA